MKTPLGLALLGALLLLGCNASNCPLSSTVTCNYYFYDEEGTAITFDDTLTVTTLMPGWKTQYTYRRLGYTTYILDYQDTALINEGYTESTQQVRNDTVLVNKLISGSSVSLPMAYYSNRDTLVFAYQSLSARDTLYVSHESYSNVELPECGAHRFHTLHTIDLPTSAAIDHVEIIDPYVDYMQRENVKIYFIGVANED